MRHAYVRFVTADLDEDSGRRRGVFQAVADLAEAGEWRDYEAEELQVLRQWFNDHLEAPDRFSRSRRSDAAPRAISWFKSSATEHVRRMYMLCRILTEHGIPTETITSARPGYIVFEDDHQIAAIPFAETTT
jgi:hypothetical protein